MTMNTNDCCGILLGADEGKLLHKAISEAPRIYFINSYGKLNGCQAIATNDPRMLKALELCNEFESFGRKVVRGIEMFYKL